MVASNLDGIDLGSCSNFGLGEVAQLTPTKSDKPKPADNSLLRYRGDPLSMAELVTGVLPGMQDLL